MFWGMLFPVFGCDRDNPVSYMTARLKILVVARKTRKHQRGRDHHSVRTSVNCEAYTLNAGHCTTVKDHVIMANFKYIWTM